MCIITTILFKKWVVVLFLKDSSISTVPSKWLSSLTGEDEDLECFWPNKKIRQHIQNASEANEEWPKFRIKILHETGKRKNNSIQGKISTLSDFST